jgi:pimeloyl-ACP methyl ester carboxylesterase
VSRTEQFHGWDDVRESGPEGAPRRVLLLPGALCGTAFLADVMAAPPLAAAPVRVVAATVPGFAGTPAPADTSMENYAALAGALAAEHGCQVMAGHSFGANIALEAAAGGHFAGPVVLLSPTFSRPDEFRELAMADRLGRLPAVGGLVWPAMVRLTPHAMADELPAARRDALSAELRRNDPASCRRILRDYFDYLDRHGSLVPRLVSAGTRAWVVRGDRDEIGLTDQEYEGLSASPRIHMVTVPHAGHMSVTDQPDRIAALLAEVAAGPYG